jgi:hypothetical protein
MAASLLTRPVPASRPYGAEQEIEYLYLEAELEMLLRQLQGLQAPESLSPQSKA